MEGISKIGVVIDHQHTRKKGKGKGRVKRIIYLHVLDEVRASGHTFAIFSSLFAFSVWMPPRRSSLFHFPVQSA